MSESYKVVRKFKDTKHNGHVYEVGETYPAEGQKTTKARVKQLSTTNNKYGKVFIEPINYEKE
ncbi:termination factor Rho [Paenibacillus bouchesdurhonensis]|uniref:termination factor Rho n=1 Tax=Paenibacillus bouchesdurhonensis TaxID=1870990 RepID=UPI000DA62906|nr:termination factor Rho [Paenibacillus bouchesdurhonensis]